MALDLDKFILPNGAPAAGKQAMQSSAYGPDNILSNIIVVRQSSDFGTIDSTKVYKIDGQVDMGTTSIALPVGGINLQGLTPGVSSLYSSEDNYTLFSSLSCGDVIHSGVTISVTGANSKVYDLKSSNGLSRYSAEKIIYQDCTSLGELDNFLQGLEDIVVRVGGSPSLTLTGAWLSGFLSSPSLVTSLDAGMTEPLFKAGTGFLMSRRFITDLNCDLPASAALTDFAPANFVFPSTLIFNDTLITRDGVLSPDDANLTPNISASDLVSAWSGNTGLPNTFVGGEMELTTEIGTAIITQNVSEVLLGTWTVADLQHFDSPANGQLRHLGVTPVEYSVSWDFILDGAPNAEYKIELIKDSGGVETVVHSQTRVINNLQGGRDVAYFTGTHHENLTQNDFTYWKVSNTTGTQNCTLELGSTWDVDAR